MNVGTPIRAGDPSPVDTFSAALDTYRAAQRAYADAKDVVDLAQTEQAAAIAALPEHRRGHPDELRAISDRLDLAAKGGAAFAARTAVTTALAALMETPAPDFLGLVAKLQAANDAPSSSAVQARRHLDKLLADSQRLTHGLRAPAGEA